MEKKKQQNKDNAKDALSGLKAKIKDVQDIVHEYDIPLENITLKIILDKMMATLEHYIKIIVQIMQPEEFSALHECTIFDDAEKARMFNTYKEMMILHREMLKSLIKNQDNDLIATIAYAHSEIHNLKPQMLSIVQKMQDSWKKTGTNGRIRYFG